MDDYADRLRVKLAPESMTRTLIRAGVFLSAYELIKLQVVDGVRDFCWTREEEDGRKVCYRDYQTDVLARYKNRYTASVLRLVEGGAITLGQADVLKEVHRHRHEIAHASEDPHRPGRLSAGLEPGHAPHLPERDS